MKTARVSQAELHQFALDEAHPFQKASYEVMHEKGWKVFSVRQQSGLTLLFVSLKSGCFGVIYPNGAFDRNKSNRSTVDFSWSKAREAAADIAQQGPAAIRIAA